MTRTRVMVAGVTVCAALALGLAGCGSSSGPQQPADMWVPVSALPNDLIPNPSPQKDVLFGYARHFELRELAAANSLPGIFTANMRTVLRDVQDSSTAWSFGLGRDELETKLGAVDVGRFETNLAAYYGRFFLQDSTGQALQSMVQRYPQWSAVDVAGVDRLKGLRIDTVSVSDAQSADEGGNGSAESAHRLVTVAATLPTMELQRPANPFPGCARLLADTAAIEQFAAQSDVRYVPPSSARWRYQIALAGHFNADMAGVPALASGVRSSGYLTQAHVDAAADSLALMRAVLENVHAQDVPGSDLQVSFAPTAELRDHTLGPIAGLARTRDDADCLRDLDAWDAAPSMLVAGLAPEHVQGLTAPRIMLQTYNASVDAGDGLLGEYGTTCLHDADGHVVQINGELTCSVSSGPIVQSVVKATGAGDAAALLSTPYQRMREQSASAGQCESKQSVAVGDGLESINHVGVGNILWNCTNTKYAGCTGRFGRGIRICMSEWLVHNQVGDYWNIRWYNNAWKASFQSVIKAGGYVIRAAISYYLGGRAWSGAVLELLDYAGGVIDSVSNTKIAGHSITGLKSAGAVILEFQKNFKNMGKDLKQAGIGFAFDMAVDMAAQMVQVQVTGWQDYSDGSHKVCDFKFK